MNMPPLLDFLAQMAAPTFFAMLFLAAMGAAVWAGLAHLAGTAKSRVFSELMARQLVGLAWPHLVLTLAAGAFWVWSMGAQVPWLPGRFLSGPMLFALIAVSATLLLCLAAQAAWGTLQPNRPLRLVVCLAAALAALAGIYLALAGLKDVTAALLGGGTHDLPAMRLYLPGPSALFWPALAGLAALALTDGGGLGLVWMTIRRNKDDFGRDYYNFALPRTARSGLLGGVIFLACQGWLLAALPPELRTLVLSGQLGLFWGAGLACVLLACLCWLLVARSATPLRLKGAGFIALVLLWPGHLLVFTVLAGLAPLA